MIASLLLALAFSSLQEAKAEIVDVRKIWDQAPHNAFTDLIRFKDRWLCVFREGKAHVSADGALRVLSSEDGDAWTSASLVTMAGADLRDAKIALMPDGRLMLSGAAAYPAGGKVGHQTFAWFSSDAKAWSEPVAIGDPDFWLWRVTWHKGRAYGIGYATKKGNTIRLYSSDDGKKFVTLVPTLFDQGEPNETSMVFLEDDTCVCLLRRDGPKGTAQLGTAKPPYKEWTWKDLGLKIGGPHLLRLSEGRIVGAGRIYDGGAHTGLLWIDAQAGKATEFLKLPSSGDNSYPGLVWHDGLLWVSYYASHEGTTSIYRAKARIPQAK
jgi:hypothetical protein